MTNEEKKTDNENSKGKLKWTSKISSALAWTIVGTLAAASLITMIILIAI